MGKKSKCCHNSTTNCSSSKSCSSSISFSNSSSNCCNKYPKCNCICTPIYCPNPCSPYPCNPCNPCVPKPCNPCQPYLPCVPNVCPPQNCASYNSNVTTITSSTTTINLTVSSPSVNLYITSQNLTDLIINLPQISTLYNCNYKKMFVLSNMSNGSNITLNTLQGDIFAPNNSPTLNFTSGMTITIYAVYTGTVNYWIIQNSEYNPT